MSKVIFQSLEHQILFEKQGFIVLDFLNEQELTELNQIFDELHPDINQSGFYSGSYSADKSYKKKASDEIVRVFSKSYHRYFKNYTPFGGAFLFKVPGENSHLSIHQDWTIVNEEENIALNCWIPLNDINENNGALHIVPGSHYLGYKTLRSPTMPFFFSGNDQLVEQAAIPMYVKAGQAIILNQSVIHFSTPNTSNEIRKAITAGIKSKDAQMYFHYKVPKKEEMEVFEMEDDFLISFNNFFEDIGKRPYLGKSIGFIPYKNPILEQEQLKKTIENLTLSSGHPYKFESTNTNFFKNFLQKIFS